MTGFEDLQKLGKENMDLAVNNIGTAAKNAQAIAVELTDYSKKAFEDGSAALEKVMAAKSLDKAFEIQADFAKTSFDGFVSQMTRIGEMYTDMAKDAYKPFETLVAKAGK